MKTKTHAILKLLLIPVIGASYILGADTNITKRDLNSTIPVLPIKIVKVEKTVKTINLTACKSCHGNNFEKRALGKSKIVKDMNYKSITEKLNGYKNGKGGPMKAIMQGQLRKYSQSDLKLIASEISNESNSTK